MTWSSVEIEIELNTDIRRSIYREWFSLPAAGDEGEALRLDGDARPLHMLLHIPETQIRNKQFLGV